MQNCTVDHLGASDTQCPMRIMVCVGNGRPIAVFSDLAAGDRWLAKNMQAVQTVYMLEDGEPGIGPIAEPLASHGLGRPSDGQIARTA